VRASTKRTMAALAVAAAAVAALLAGLLFSLQTICLGQPSEESAQPTWHLLETENSTSKYADTGCWPQHSASISSENSSTSVITTADWDSSCAGGTCSGTARSSCRWTDPASLLIPGAVINISASYELSGRQTCGSKTFDTSVRVYVTHRGQRETLPGGPSILGWSSDAPAARGFGTVFWQVPSVDPGEWITIEVMGSGPGGSASKRYNYAFEDAA